MDEVRVGVYFVSDASKSAVPVGIQKFIHIFAGGVCAHTPPANIYVHGMPERSCVNGLIAKEKKDFDTKMIYERK